jgi:hypothetical protein
LDELIKLDTNNDRSFGKLKVWSSNAHAIYSLIFLCQQHTSPDYDVLFSSFTFSAQAATTYNSPGVTIQAGRHFAICGFKSTIGNASSGKLGCFFPAQHYPCMPAEC